MDVVAYFDDIQTEIKVRIQQSNKSIKIAVAYFTDKEIFTILCLKAKSGVKVQLIISDEDVNFKNGDVKFDELITQGGELYIYIAEQRSILHNKFCIIDDSIVISGSYNWSYKAKKNLENIIVIDNHITLVETFQNEFKKILESSVNRATTGPVKLLPTGVIEFDNAFGGFYAFSNTVIYSTNEEELSKFLISLLNRLLINKEHEIAFLSLKDQQSTIISRFISLRTKIPIHRVKNGKLSEYETMIVWRGGEEMASKKFFIQTPNSGIREIKECIKTLRYQKNIKLIVIEDLNSIIGSNDEYNSNKNFENVMFELRKIGYEFGIPILSSLNIINKQSRYKTDQNSEEIEITKEFADTVYCVRKPEYYEINMDSFEDQNRHYIVDSVKNRYSTTNSIRLDLDFGIIDPQPKEEHRIFIAKSDKRFTNIDFDEEAPF